MKMLKTQSGPFVERPYYEDSDIESIVTGVPPHTRG